jgi:hypothetical protein
LITERVFCAVAADRISFSNEGEGGTENLPDNSRMGQGRVDPATHSQPTSRTPVLLLQFISLSTTIMVKGMKINLIIVEQVVEG